MENLTIFKHMPMIPGTIIGLANNTTYIFSSLDSLSEKNCLLGIEAGNYSISDRDFLALYKLKEYADAKNFQLAEINDGGNRLVVTMVEATMNNGKKISIAKICQECKSIEPFILSENDIVNLHYSLAFRPN